MCAQYVCRWHIPFIMVLYDLQASCCQCLTVVGSSTVPYKLQCQGTDRGHRQNPPADVDHSDGTPLPDVVVVDSY